MSGGEQVARVLDRQGVRFLYTLCGGHISPILVAAERLGIRVVDVRHEANAVFAADATARLTGVPGVAAVTAGPGVTNTLTALKNAQLAQSPLVLLGGATATVLKGRGALQDIDQRELILPHVKRAWFVERVRDLPAALTAAFEVAASGVPGPVFVECPVDLLYPEALVRSWYAAKTDREPRSLREHAERFYLRRHLDRLFAGAAEAEVPAPAPIAVPAPAEAAVTRAAELLARAERPVLVVGSQALATSTQAEALAEAISRLGLPTYLGGMARGLLGPGSAIQLRHERRAALREADLVLLAGFPCDFRLDYGAQIRGGTALIAINRDRHEARLNRKPNLTVVADAAAFLIELSLRLHTPPPGRDAWLEGLRARDAARDEKIAAEAAVASERVNPLALFAGLEAELPTPSVLVADGGDFVATASYILRPRGPLSWLDPGAFGTLGVGPGFALAAKLCRPEAEVYLIWGDGAAGLSLAELDTFARHRLPVIALLGNDASWAQIARDQVEILGSAVGTVLARCDYHVAADGLGAHGLLLRTNDEIAPVLARAREVAAASHPVLINALLARTDFRKGSMSM